MTAWPSWEDIRHQLVDGGWFDEDRTKTIGALQRVTERMSEDELVTVMERVGIVFAPSPSLLGEVYPSGGPSPSSHFVYLAAHLEHLEQTKVDSVVAHELAHIISHPMLPDANRSHPDQEEETDQVIERWGFGPAYQDEDSEVRCPTCGARALPPG